MKELPRSRGKLSDHSRQLANRAKELLIELAQISTEIAQMAVTPDSGEALPGWFVLEATRDIPGLLQKKLG